MPHVGQEARKSDTDYTRTQPPRTINCYRSTIHRTSPQPSGRFRSRRHALGRAVKWGLLAQNPALRADPPARAVYEPSLWDLEQIHLFLGEAQRSSHYYPLYLAAITTGMRQGELLGLRWRDIDWVTGTAIVRQKFYRLGGRMIFGVPKNKRARPITMTANLTETLRHVQRAQGDQRGLLGDAYADHDLVFCQPNGNPLHAHNIVQRDFHRVGRRARLPRLRFHDLRHLHASYLFLAGVHPKIAHERLGHHSPAYTMQVYGHLLPGMQEEAARRIERLLGGPDPGNSLE